MVNVTNIFLKKTKQIMKEKGLSPFEYVICFVCGELVELQVSLNILIVPLVEFENDKRKLPFKTFSFYKKNGCLLASETGSFFHFINKRITINKEGKIVFLKSPEKGKNSICWFIGQCLSEYLENEKLTKKELARNLKMSVNKLNKIFKGEAGDINLVDMISISFEFEGKNKKSTYKVIVEKYPEKKVYKDDSVFSYIE